MAVTEQTIVVTGGAGFVGSHLADALVDENDVRVLDTLDTGHREQVPDAATFIEGDVRDAAALNDAMAGADLVYHQAAMVSVPGSIEQPAESHDVNVNGTGAVLEAARREDARIVLASSAAIYGHPESVPIAEDAATEPASPYGLQKLTADSYARLYHELYDLETVVLRPFNAYGPRQNGGPYSGVVSTFLEQARAGGPITVEGDGMQTRDFVHVDDMVDAYLAAGETDRVGEAFNVGTRKRVSIKELAKTVRKVTGSDAEIVHEEPREGDIRHSCADIAKAKRVLDFEPTFDLCRGLRSFVSSKVEV